MNDHSIPIDWRYRVATTIAEDYVDPDKGLYPKGSFVAANTFVKHDGREIQLGDPSATALFLNSSYKAYQAAMAMHPFLLPDWPPSDWTGDPSTKVYDYLEEIIASVAFAYTALEAFANELIPEEFVYEFEETKDSGIVAIHQYDKEKIERKTSLSEKLATILPLITKKMSPKGQKVWDNYVTLRRLRDRVIHLKSSDRLRSKADNLYPDSIWKELLAPKQTNYPLTAKNMILYFRDEQNAHWLKYCPF